MPMGAIDKSYCGILRQAWQGRARKIEARERLEGKGQRGGELKSALPQNDSLATLLVLLFLHQAIRWPIAGPVQAKSP